MGEYISPPDHNIFSPFYCVHVWKQQTSASLKEERYYTLFSLKERYHKLFTPWTQVKFFCCPSEQVTEVNLDSSVLFAKRKKADVIRYKYNFLNSNEQEIKTSNGVECDSEQIEISSDDVSDVNSENTVIYNGCSYKNTGKKID